MHSMVTKKPLYRDLSLTAIHVNFLLRPENCSKLKYLVFNIYFSLTFSENAL